MTTEDDHKAIELCENLNQENISRREICEQITEEAINQVLNTIDLRNDKVIVVGSDDWHHGVIGIAASRLVEKFHLPVFIVSLSGEKSRGSVRGINNSNLDIFKEMQTLQNQNLKNNLSIAFTPQINEFRGRRSIQLDIKDYKETEQVDEKILARVKQVEARFKK